MFELYDTYKNGVIFLRVVYWNDQVSRILFIYDKSYHAIFNLLFCMDSSHGYSYLVHIRISWLLDVKYMVILIQYFMERLHFHYKKMKVILNDWLKAVVNVFLRFSLSFFSLGKKSTLGPWNPTVYKYRPARTRLL